MAENQEIFNQEIAELEAKLAAKKRELLTSNAESSEKEIFKQVVREHASGTEAGLTMSVPSQNPQTTAPVRTATPQEEQKIQALIGEAFNKGLSHAVRSARATGDAYFVDLLHDRLSDEYYQKLLQARKINQR